MGEAEKVRVRFPWTPSLSDASPEIAPLTSGDVRGLRLPWMSRFSSETLQVHLRANPGMALWVPKTGEYVVAEQWRRRADIAHIVEAHARRGKDALVDTFLKRARDQGCCLALISDDIWNGTPRLYAGLGFKHAERIVFFQKDLRSYNAVEHLSHLPEVATILAGRSDLDLLQALDHDSFPWLWWNSRPEFEEYICASGVSVYIARLGDEPIGYASFTIYNGWAHLDRLAVTRAHQGRKLGAAQLARTLRAMRDLGAASVGLSTQQSNTQSHALYRRFGFRQTREQMNLYGMELGVGSQ